jgi:hypothetical protein
VSVRTGIGAAVLVAVALVVPGPSASDHGAVAALRPFVAGANIAARPCALVGRGQVKFALGVDTDAYVAGPRSETPASCSWHSAQPNCFSRSLSVVLDAASGSAGRFAELQATALPLDVVDGLGDDAFFTTEPLPPGAAVAIEHLSIRRGSVWVEMTMLGRISGDSAHELMRAIAPAIVNRLGTLTS